MKMRHRCTIVARALVRALLGCAGAGCVLSGCATSAPANQRVGPSTERAGGQADGLSVAARSATIAPRGTTPALVFASARQRELEQSEGVTRTAFADDPAFARNDHRLGSPPPMLGDAGVAWRITFDQQLIQSGRPWPTYRQTFRAVERTTQ